MATNVKISTYYLFPLYLEDYNINNFCYKIHFEGFKNAARCVALRLLERRLTFAEALADAAR